MSNFFLLSTLCGGNLVCAKCKATSLKYGLTKYPAWISFTVTGKFVPFYTSLCTVFNILSTSACLGKYLSTKFLQLTCPCNFCDSYRYSFPGLLYNSWMIPSCCLTFSSKSILRSCSIASTSTGSSSMFSGWCAVVIGSIGLSDGLGCDGRKGSLHAGNLYLDSLRGVFFLRVAWL